ncbi:hypothetical protein M0M57_12970 [Flavobacterium azooxidireducens]|uniref:Uncharacterized protein n=1 Tax=Flavobacterium azooxidireducens TaxID=1871076 RepID=A0ABY4KCL2_9FLAO|nr:hypothetical protein [Flavobacterium azooxidireducens]UPQ78527.1 hypothetical protein M0M57_12970 [Flavobacterium azooxidireducens]
MIDKNKYNFKWGNNLLDINTLSPDSSFYYQIKVPFDYYWSLFLTKISFLDENKNIIYYNKNAFVSPLNSINENILKYVMFSNDGQFAYFLERTKLNNLSHILLDLKNLKFKKVEWNSEKNSSKLNCDENGFEVENLFLFDKTNWLPTLKDKRKERNFFGFKLWNPKI